MAGSKDIWICVFLIYISIALWHLIIFYSNHTLASSHFALASPIESSSYSVPKNYIQVHGLRRPLCACVWSAVQCAESWAHVANCLLCMLPDVSNELSLPPLIPKVQVRDLGLFLTFSLFKSFSKSGNTRCQFHLLNTSPSRAPLGAPASSWPLRPMSSCIRSPPSSALSPE